MDGGRTQQDIDGDMLPGQRPFGPLLLSAGAMKAGTTWLYSVLERHPQLHFSPEKELHYFYHRYCDDRQLSDRNRLRLVHDRYAAGFDPVRANPDRVRLNLLWSAQYLTRPVDDMWFRNLFFRPEGAVYCCDFSNLHAHLPVSAWQRIEADSDRLRVLYTLREPVSRLWSHVKFHLQISGRLEQLASWGPAQMTQFLRQDFIWNNAEYGQVLRRMRAGLSEQALLPVFYEEIRRDPAGQLARIEAFLGLAPFSYPPELLARQVNASARLPMPGYFPGLVARDVARITKELRDLGLSLPPEWSRDRV